MKKKEEFDKKGFDTKLENHQHLMLFDYFYKIVTKEDVTELVDI